MSYIGSYAVGHYAQAGVEIVLGVGIAIFTGNIWVQAAGAVLAFFGIIDAAMTFEDYLDIKSAAQEAISQCDCPC